MDSDRKNSVEGVGLGVGLVLASLVALALPGILSAADAWETVLYCAAILLGGIGMCGALLDIGRLRKRQSMESFGVSTLFAIGAGIPLLILVRHELWSALDVILIVLLAAFAIVFFGFFGMGVSAAVAESNAFQGGGPREADAGRSGTRPAGPDRGGRGRPDPNRLTKAEKITIFVTVIVGIASAVSPIVVALVQEGLIL
ncbi:hypothetical protein ACFO4E_12845 [Nocardiopsis mangrovi]|uniref:Uncharacterized protein n=1 Tax=Nocardiopsis mangrovi TaxID=1179818 RepID=A0ABV9DXB5_9ACTN